MNRTAFTLGFVAVHLAFAAAFLLSFLSQLH